MPSDYRADLRHLPGQPLLAAAKAGDALKGVKIPPAAEKLRRLMHCAQLVQSHALSFFLLSGPDLLLGMESDPEKRNLIGLLEALPQVAQGGYPAQAVRPGSDPHAG